MRRHRRQDSPARNSHRSCGIDTRMHADDLEHHSNLHGSRACGTAATARHMNICFGRPLEWFVVVPCVANWGADCGIALLEAIVWESWKPTPITRGSSLKVRSGREWDPSRKFASKHHVDLSRQSWDRIRSGSQFQPLDACAPKT